MADIEWIGSLTHSLFLSLSLSLFQDLQKLFYFLQHKMGETFWIH